MRHVDNDSWSAFRIHFDNEWKLWEPFQLRRVF